MIAGLRAGDRSSLAEGSPLKKSNFIGSLLQSRRGHVLAGLLFGGGLLLGSAKVSASPAQAHRLEATAAQLQAWRDLLARAMPLSEDEKLEAVNRFFNREVRFVEDSQLWGQRDYWASPFELLAEGAGDCEDYALAKYFTLRLLGVPERRLRLVYSNLTSNGQAHMVLGYWSDNGELPLILDNLRAEIAPLTQRHDLEMQFAFDRDRLYRFADNRLVDAGDARLLSRWTALQTRVARELRHSMGDEGVMLAAARSREPAS